MCSAEVQRDERQGRISSETLDLETYMWLCKPILETGVRLQEYPAIANQVKIRRLRDRSGVMFEKTRDLKYLQAYTECFVWPRAVQFRYMWEVLSGAR